MGLLSSKPRKEKIRMPKEPTGKIYRTVSSATIVGVFLTVGIIVLAVMGTIRMSADLTCFVSILAILCLESLQTLPWIRKIEKKEFKKTSITFIAIICVSALLWIICIILIISIYKDIAYERTNIETVAFINKCLATVNFVKYTILFTIQLSVASFIGTCLTKYKKSYIVFQVMSYLSYLVFDVWISAFILSIGIKGHLSGVEVITDLFMINKNLLDILINKTVVTIMILAAIYIGISNGILKRIETRRVQYASEDIAFGSDNIVSSASQQNSESVEDKLNNLKSLYEKDLISKEEYEQKRSDILKDM